MVGGLYQAGRCALDAIVRNDSRIERGDDQPASRDGLPGQRGLRGLGFERRDGGAGEGDVDSAKAGLKETGAQDIASTSETDSDHKAGDKRTYDNLSGSKPLGDHDVKKYYRTQ